MEPRASEVWGPPRVEPFSAGGPSTVAALLLGVHCSDLKVRFELTDCWARKRKIGQQIARTVYRPCRRCLSIPCGNPAAQPRGCLSCDGTQMRCSTLHGPVGRGSLVALSQRARELLQEGRCTSPFDARVGGCIGLLRALRRAASWQPRCSKPGASEQITCPALLVRQPRTRLRLRLGTR
jgi:hypothetical protein